MDKLVSSAIEENPIAFKHEFETLMKTKIDNLVAQQKQEIASSISIDGENVEPTDSE